MKIKHWKQTVVLNTLSLMILAFLFGRFPHGPGIRTPEEAAAKAAPDEPVPQAAEAPQVEPEPSIAAETEAALAQFGLSGTSVISMSLTAQPVQPVVIGRQIEEVK